LRFRVHLGPVGAWSQELGFIASELLLSVLYGLYEIRVAPLLLWVYSLRLAARPQNSP